MVHALETLNAEQGIMGVDISHWEKEIDAQLKYLNKKGKHFAELKFFYIDDLELKAIVKSYEENGWKCTVRTDTRGTRTLTIETLLDYSRRVANTKKIFFVTFLCCSFALLGLVVFLLSIIYLSK